MFGMNVLNAKEWRQSESISAKVSASARGLAKLGPSMAQRGTANGKTIMSEKAWEEFHGGLDTRVDFGIGMVTSFTNGGVAYDMFTDPTSQGGFYGWGGFGGSVWQWNPEMELSFAYVPLDLNPGANNRRGEYLQALV